MGKHEGPVELLDDIVAHYKKEYGLPVSYEINSTGRTILLLFGKCSYRPSYGSALARLSRAIMQSDDLAGFEIREMPAKDEIFDEIVAPAEKYFGAEVDYEIDHRLRTVTFCIYKASDSISRHIRGRFQGILRTDAKYWMSYTAVEIR